MMHNAQLVSASKVCFCVAAVVAGRGQRSQPVKSKGNQNCARLVDQSVDEDLCDLSATSCWNEDTGV